MDKCKLVELVQKSQTLTTDEVALLLACEENPIYGLFNQSKTMDRSRYEEARDSLRSKGYLDGVKLSEKGKNLFVNR